MTGQYFPVLSRGSVALSPTGLQDGYRPAPSGPLIAARTFHVL